MCPTVMRSYRTAPIAVALWLAAATAHGQASTAHVAAAEALFRQGHELIQAGKASEACPKLEESQRIDPTGSTALMLAECFEKTGKLASASVRYQGARDFARKRGLSDKEKERGAKIAALEVGLSTLRIVVPASVASLPGLEVRRDGAVVGPGAWGAALPADPGSATIEATARGKKRWSVSVAIGGKADLVTVSLPKAMFGSGEKLTSGDLNGNFKALADAVTVLETKTSGNILGLTAATDGKWTAGSSVGYVAGRKKCQAVFPASPTAHVCSAPETVRSLSEGSTVDTGPNGAWVVSGVHWFSDPKSGPRYVSSDCTGYTDNSAGTAVITPQGALLVTSGPAGPTFGACAAVLPILCCD